MAWYLDGLYPTCAYSANLNKLDGLNGLFHSNLFFSSRSSPCSHLAWTPWSGIFYSGLRRLHKEKWRVYGRDMIESLFIWRRAPRFQGPLSSFLTCFSIRKWTDSSFISLEIRLHMCLCLAYRLPRNRRGQTSSQLLVLSLILAL